MVQLLTYLTFFICWLFVSLANAKPLVNGWHKILVGGQHSGYLIQEYAFDKKAKQFTATNFTRIMLPGRDITRSLKATAKKNLSPISFQYTEQSGKSTKLINGVFEKGVMTVTVTQNGNSGTPLQMKLEKGTFLGTFLYVLMITNKSGMKVGNHFAYSAIAEDSGTAHVGTADVKEFQTIDGLDTFKILNNFKNSKTIEHVTPVGQVVRTKDPFNNVETRLVATQSEAVGGFPLSPSSLKLLFGTIPGESFPKPVASIHLQPQTDSTKNSLPPGVSPPPGKKPPKDK